MERHFAICSLSAFDTASCVRVSRAPVKKETCSFRSLAFTAERWRASRSLSIRRNRRRTLLPCLHSAIHRWRRARGSALLAHCRRLRIGHADRAVLSPSRRTFAKLVPKVGSSWTSFAQSALLYAIRLAVNSSQGATICSREHGTGPWTRRLSGFLATQLS